MNRPLREANCTRIHLCWARWNTKIHRIKYNRFYINIVIDLIVCTLKYTSVVVVFIANWNAHNRSENCEYILSIQMALTHCLCHSVRPCYCFKKTEAVNSSTENYIHYYFSSREYCIEISFVRISSKHQNRQTREIKNATHTELHTLFLYILAQTKVLNVKIHKLRQQIKME